MNPPETWRQKDSADERGMNFIRWDYKWDDALHHVNNQGFWARWDYNTNTIDSLKKLGYKIVFIIGDSFTEGVTMPGDWSGTFCEVIKRDMLTQKYLICPFGIAGTSPLQYHLVAEKFIPLLKPDMVFTAFCGANDFYNRKQIITPHIPSYWQTNVGFFSSNINNEIILPTRDSAYRFFQKISPLATGPWLCRHSYLLSRIYSLFTSPSSVMGNSPHLDRMIDYDHFNEIKQICKKYNAVFSIVFIPDYSVPTLVSQMQADSLYVPGFGFLQKDVTYYLKGDIT